MTYTNAISIIELLDECTHVVAMIYGGKYK